MGRCCARYVYQGQWCFDKVFGPHDKLLPSEEKHRYTFIQCHAEAVMVVDGHQYCQQHDPANHCFWSDYVTLSLAEAKSRRFGIITPVR
jgi:hypothetical protein